MKREILFRGFQATWIYGGISIIEGCATITDYSKADYGSYEVDINSVGQFIGIKDKNGKKIFEGDYCRRFNYLYEVYWSKSSLQFLIQVVARKEDFGNEWIREGSGSFQIELDDINEVIGNIHENKELIK